MATPRKRPEDKKKVGRPTIWCPELREQILILAAAGKTEMQICFNLGINYQTIQVWKKKYPEFLDTLKQAKELVDQRVVGSLLEKAEGYVREEEITFKTKDGKYLKRKKETYYPPDTTAIIFWLKNRQRKAWTDTQRKEITGKDGKPLADNGPIITVTLPANGREAKEEDKK